MHVFATNESFLKLYYDEAVAMIEEVDIKTAEKFLFYVIYPDNRGVTPLETALREHAPKCGDNVGNAQTQTSLPLFQVPPEALL